MKVTVTPDAAPAVTVELTEEEASRLAWCLRFGQMDPSPFVAGVLEQEGAQAFMRSLGKALMRAGVPLRPWFVREAEDG